MRHNSPLVTILPALPVGISDVEEQSVCRQRISRALRSAPVLVSFTTAMIVLVLASVVFATAMFVGIDWLIR
jgi:hypothetical protein